MIDSIARRDKIHAPDGTWAVARHDRENAEIVCTNGVRTKVFLHEHLLRGDALHEPAGEQWDNVRLSREGHAQGLVWHFDADFAR